MFQMNTSRIEPLTKTHDKALTNCAAHHFYLFSYILI